MRELTGNATAAFVGGLLFAFAPYRCHSRRTCRCCRASGCRSCSTGSLAISTPGGCVRWPARRSRWSFRTCRRAITCCTSRRSPRRTCCGKMARRHRWRDRRMWLQLPPRRSSSPRHGAVSSAVRGDARPVEHAAPGGGGLAILGRRLLVRHRVQRAAHLGRHPAGLPETRGRPLSRARSSAAGTRRHRVVPTSPARRRERDQAAGASMVRVAAGWRGRGARGGRDRRAGVPPHHLRLLAGSNCG